MCGSIPTVSGVRDMPVFSKPLKNTKVSGKSVKIEELPQIELVVDYWSGKATEIEGLSNPEQAIQLLEDAQMKKGIAEFIQGGVLSKVKDEEWFAPHKDVYEFAAHMFGFERRKTQYLMSNYLTLLENNIGFEQIDGLGWTKVREIVSKAANTDIDVAEWLEKAKGLTVLELKAALKADPLVEEHVEDVFKTLSYKLALDSAKVVQEAIDAVSENADTHSPGHALFLICVDYLAGADVDVGHSKLSE